MELGKFNLIDLLGADKREFYCPPIQRAYVWSTKQRDVLLSDLTEAHAVDSIHFTGTLITAPAGQVQRVSHGRTTLVHRVLVVDGQQRLTTLSILLAVARKHLSLVDEPSAIEITANVNRCLHLLGEPRFKPTEADRAAFAAVLNGSFEGKREIQKAAREFDAALGELSPDDLLGLLDSVLSRTQFVVLALDQDDDPCAYFATANGRGVPLTPAELTKNLLMMKSGVKDLTAAAARYWDPLTTDLSNFRVQALIKETTFLRHGWMTGRAIYRKIELDVAEMGLDAYFADLTAWKDAFCLVEAKLFLTKGLSPGVLRALRRLSLTRTALPPGAQFLWAVPVRLWQEKKLSDAELLECLLVVDNYTMRLLGRFGTTCRDLAKPMREVLTLQGTAAVAKFSQLVFGVEAYRSQTDEKLRERLTTMPFSLKGPDRGWLLACLLGLERDVQSDCAEPDEPTIEHIAPKKLESAPAWAHLFGEDERYLVHTLGNLTVLSMDHNRKVAQVSFEDKQSVLATSFMATNRALALSHTTWAAPEIQARTAEMAEQVLRLWPQIKV